MSNPNATAMRTMNLVGAHALESVLLVLVEAASPHSTHANEDKASHNRADGAGLEWQIFEHISWTVSVEYIRVIRRGVIKRLRTPGKRRILESSFRLGHKGSMNARLGHCKYPLGTACRGGRCQRICPLHT